MKPSRLCKDCKKKYAQEMGLCRSCQNKRIGHTPINNWFGRKGKSK